MQTVTIDILNDKAVKLLQDLELLQLIRVRKEKNKRPIESNHFVKYKGAMTKQPLRIGEQKSNVQQVIKCVTFRSCM